jgi:hypothetical protein
MGKPLELFGRLSPASSKEPKVRMAASLGTSGNERGRSRPRLGGRCVETICETGRRRVRRRQANSAAGQDGERTSRHQYQGFQGPETVFDRQPTEDFTLRRESPGVGPLPPVGVHRNHLGY